MTVLARRPRERGLREFWLRLKEATAILTGRWSLHRSWQAGLDEGSRAEWERICNGGDMLWLPGEWERRRKINLALAAQMQAARGPLDIEGSGAAAPTSSARVGA